METVADHEIEPEIAAPPPRTAGLHPSVNLLMLAACLLFALFLYGGGRALWEAVKLGWVAVAGRTVTAHVQDVRTEPASVKGQPPRQTALQYAFTSPTDGSVQSRWMRLGGGDEASAGPMRSPSGATPVPVVHVGDALPVRCAAWPGGGLSYPWTKEAPGRIVFLTLSGGAIIVISVLLWRKLGYWRRQRLRLLRHGIATAGTILHKEARAEDAPRYFIRYGYASGDGPHEREEQVSQEQWKTLEVGQPVTVLYDPDHAEEAGLYTLVRR